MRGADEVLMAEMIPIYPLKFDPIYKEKVWGGRSLEKLGRNLPGGMIGESWELADLGTTSVSGGGGGSERSVITNGPLAGKTFHDVILSATEAMLGDLPLNEFGEFPLLVKFLDANDNLSVQVHPSESYAHNHDDAYLKSEAWYIVEAAPDAVIYKGVHDGVSPEAFRKAIEENTVEPLMISVPVKQGDCHYLPSGTCHALGKGILVAEVQTPSDTTFRVYDWGRTGRELHIEQAMQCIHFGPPEVGRNEKRTHVIGEFAQATRLVRCEHFNIDQISMNQGYTEDVVTGSPVVWMILKGGGRIISETIDDVSFEQGESIFIPAGMEESHMIVDEDTLRLEVTFPQALPAKFA